MNNNKTPDKILESLLNNATTRTERSLKLIHRICSEQVERGSSDFRVSTIGKLSEVAGGSGHGAIRNKGGERYRVLIAAWNNQNKDHSPKSTSRHKEDDWIEEISQHDIRWLIRDILKEVKDLRNENNLLKSKIVLNVDLREPSTSIKAIENQTLATLTNSELIAIKSAISTQHLEKMGWIKDHRGRVSDHNNKQIFKSGFIVALEKLLSSLER